VIEAFVAPFHTEEAERFRMSEQESQCSTPVPAVAGMRQKAVLSECGTPRTVPPAPE